ncbi:MAG TPA: FGGY-family carbohydrate kinase [Acidimicrobiales bacterium]|nr:FGGY-family carbohydrate kinase [Acidimicrobiales bacterium]
MAVKGGGSSLLVIDVGTSGVRAAVVRPDTSVEHVVHRSVLPATPAPGLVEFDARRVAEVAVEVATEVLAGSGPVAGLGIANQRGTTVVWDRRTGEPVGPGLGWQDLRTVGTCLALQAEGFRFPPYAAATKVAALLDEADPGRARAAEELVFGTVDTWLVWVLCGGAAAGAPHVTDATNAEVTWLARLDTLDWDDRALEVLRIPRAMLPRVVDSSGPVGEAVLLPGAPAICGLAGDQQASLVGQGCTLPGLAKVTFGTGGMLDLCVGAERPDALEPSATGTFPIVAWQREGAPTWGVEAMMVTAGTCVEWLRDDLGVLDDAAQSAEVAAACPDTGGVAFVPSLLGMGTPVWDFGARGTLLGLTRGTGRPELVRAVLEGVADRGADLLEAAEAASTLRVEALRADGGMTANEVFVQALADATGRPVEVAPVTEATTLGAGFLAGLAVGTWRDEEEVAAAYRPSATVEPSIDDGTRAARRARWLEARSRAEHTIPELSGIRF